LGNGHSKPEVAALCQVSLRRVYQVAGVKRPKPRVTAVLIAEIAKRRGRGESVRSIAADLKISRLTASRATPAAPPAKRRPTHQVTDAERADVIRRLRSKQAKRWIAEEVGVSRGTVDRIEASLRESVVSSQ
jgi:DNA-binding CsgD family transcriptional regulator